MDFGNVIFLFLVFEIRSEKGVRGFLNNLYFHKVILLRCCLLFLNLVLVFIRLGSSSKVSFIISKIVEFLLLITDIKFKKFSLSYLSLDFT